MKRAQIFMQIVLLIIVIDSQQVAVQLTLLSAGR
jgi:hypothetical protein